MHKLELILAIVFIFITGALSLLAPWILRIAIDTIETETIAFHLLKFSSFLLGVAIIDGIFRFYMRKILVGVSRKIEYSLRLDLFSHLQTLDVFYFTENKTGSIMALLTNDLDAVRTFLGPGIMNLFNTIFVFSSTLIVMFIINYKLTLYSLIAIPVLPLVVWKLSSILFERSRKSQEQYATVSARTQESFAGIKVVKSFVQEKNELNEFLKLNKEFVRRNLSLAQIRAIFWPVMTLIGGAGSLIVLLIGGKQVINGNISLGEFVQFSAYIIALTWPLISLGWVINLIQRGGASMGRINEVFKKEPKIKPPKIPSLITKINGNLKFENIYFFYPQITAPAYSISEPESFKKDLKELSQMQLENKTAISINEEITEKDADHENSRTIFTKQNLNNIRKKTGNFTPDDEIIAKENEELYNNPYYNKDKYFLKNINFEIKKGMTLGITGLTGSGKTTLINLIPRLYDSSAGNILIDDINIKNIPLELLRNSIGLVTQEPFLFSKSIKDNIIFGREYLLEKESEQKLMEKITVAARISMLHEEITEFPDGYETIIGERGVTLSGGQKQRLAIARALVVEPSILILDDAFSNVDTQTEELILKALEEKTVNITKILISHRISTIKNSGLIIVMDNGEIQETGKHNTLIKKAGIYRRLYLRQQLSAELEDELEEI